MIVFATMRWLQVKATDGTVRFAVRNGEKARLLERAHDGVATTLDLLVAIDERGIDAHAWLADAEAAGAFKEMPWAELASESSGGPRLTLPLTPPEVWGAGVTYRRSADFREEGSGIYDRVYESARPELFFKASAWRCAGPGEPIGRRRDSTFTACEPELAVVLGRQGTVLAFTLANDVSAWDIERDNPLYLPQSKIYTGCFSCGPVLVTADEVPDPYALTLHCRVERAGREVFSGEATTGQLKRRIPELVDWLLRSNEIRTGTVLSTGTGIIQPLGSGLEEGDVATVSCAEIGELRNPVISV
jgi:2-dehydro-3-deoxy-D-arabinonate dehydratase